MLAYAIFAITFVVTLIAAVMYLYPSSKNQSTIPGLDPVSKEDGNLGDVAKSGSLHEFLMDLHKQFGAIASFWWGPIYTVSIADPKLFKEHHNVFDRPCDLFAMFKPLIGPKCIQYANGADGRARRKLYDKCLTAEAIHKYFGPIQEVADGMCTKWDTLVTEQHIPLCQYMTMFALKSALIALFGESMTDDKKVLEFKTVYDIVWSEMELRLTEPPTETREKALQEGKKKLMAVAMKLVNHRKKDPPQHGEELLLDLLLDYTEDEELQFSDAIAYVIGGFHTTGNLLAWGFYFMATHPEVQEKVYNELQDKLGDEEVDHTNIGDLHYLRQVIDETLRCAVVAPWAARFQDFDSELGGHKIPKNTPVIHALGVAGKDEAVWPLPDKYKNIQWKDDGFTQMSFCEIKLRGTSGISFHLLKPESCWCNYRFDPDRFTHENARHRATLSHVPFGFAGKRVCPGQRFAYAEATVLFATILKKFKVKMVEGQVIEPVHGLVTHPSEEIWVTISRR